MSKCFNCQSLWCQTVWHQLQFVICIVRFAFWIWTAKAPISQYLALRNMANIEQRSKFQLLQNLCPRDAEGLGKRRPDATACSVPPAIVSRLRKPHIIAQQRRGRTRGYHTARPTAPCSTPARETSSWSMSAWGVSSCNFSKPSYKLQKMDMSAG